jgi:hypothetical protein
MEVNVDSVVPQVVFDFLIQSLLELTRGFVANH